MIHDDFMKAFDDMSLHLKEDSSGEWSISRIELTEAQVELAVIRSAMRPHPSTMYNHYLEAGKTYTRLMNRTDGVVMSDTPFERATNHEIVQRAKGDVLIAGLGLGMVPIAMQENDNVYTIDIVEKSGDVLNLVLPQIERKMRKLSRVILGDIHDFKRMTRPMDTYDTIYFDIWPSITTDNLPDMRKLHRSFRSRLREGGVLDSWMYDALLYMERRDRRRGSW